MSEWQPIETAPKVEGVYYLGFDLESADAHARAAAGICVITWIPEDEEDEYWQGGWQVQPFSEGLDCIEWPNLTHWMPLPLPPAPLPTEGE